MSNVFNSLEELLQKSENLKIMDTMVNEISKRINKEINRNPYAELSSHLNFKDYELDRKLIVLFRIFQFRAKKRATDISIEYIGEVFKLAEKFVEKCKSSDYFNQPGYTFDNYAKDCYIYAFQRFLS